MRRRRRDERGKTRNDAGCAAMKRGTDDAKGRQGGRGTRRTVDENCLKSSDTYRGTEKDADSVSVILGVKEKIRPAWLSFGIVNFYDKYSLFHVILCPPHLSLVSIEKSNASSRRYRRVVFRYICRCHDDAISSFITLISGPGFITRQAVNDVR